MAKFRKKPIVIEAEQWFPGKNVDGVDLSIHPNNKGVFDKMIASIQTLEGVSCEIFN